MNAHATYRSTRKCFLHCLLVLALLAPASALPGSEGPGLAELHALVLSLQAEVQDLKTQLAGQAASVPASAPAPRAAAEPAENPVAGPQVRAKYGIDLYGYFKLDAFHDSAMTSHQIPFWTLPESDNDNGEFDMTMKETRIGLDFGGPPLGNGKLSARLEMDFYGNVSRPGNYGTEHAYQLRTRHAYLNWASGDWSVLAGKTWEPYIISIPDTLNFAYYNFQGQIGFRKTQLRFTRDFDLGGGSKLSWVGALLDPWGAFCGGDLDGDGQDDAMDAELPVFSTKLSYRLPLVDERPAEFALAAVYGRERFDVYNRDFDIWAVQAGFVVPLSDALTWKLSMYRGANLDSLWGNIAQGIHELEEIDGQGGWTQLQLRTGDALRFTLGYSVDNPQDADLGPLMRSRNVTWLVNGYYAFGPALQLGLEYLDMQTDYRDSTAATDHRLQSALIYRF
jgi:hypothetical protein